MKRRVLLFLLILMIGLLSYFLIVWYPQLPVATGYAAKKMCSCSFIAERDEESIQNEDLSMSPLNLTSSTIDLDRVSATSSVFGLGSRTAEYRMDLGCVLLDGKDDHGVFLNIEKPRLADTVDWPRGKRVNLPQSNADIDLIKLYDAIDGAFDLSLNMDSAKTRAVVVVHKSQLIAEKYANGFDAETPILGWSMTKSITSTMIGILVKNGFMQLEDKQLFNEWTDDRKEISLRDMLQMQSGLEFSEVYDQLSDANRMFFKSENVSDIPLNKPLAYPPGSHWSYSSGTTNLLQRLIRSQFDDQNDYFLFPYDSLFTRIGMSSAVMETDESGLFIGSSYCYATPRDWAKFGLLYLNQGNWNGDQIIDTSWVDFVSSPASNSGGVYGGQFWLNVDQNNFPDVPEDAYFCNGFQGQHVVIIPSYDLIVVRMGLAEYPDFSLNDLVKEVLESFI